MIYSTKFLTLKRQKLTLGICEQPTAWFSDNHCVLPPRCCAVTVSSAFECLCIKIKSNCSHSTLGGIDSLFLCCPAVLSGSLFTIQHQTDVFVTRVTERFYPCDLLFYCLTTSLLCLKQFLSFRYGASTQTAASIALWTWTSLSARSLLVTKYIKPNSVQHFYWIFLEVCKFCHVFTFLNVTKIYKDVFTAVLEEWGHTVYRKCDVDNHII